MGSIRKIERLGPELHSDAFAEIEFAEDAEIQVCDTGAAENVKSGGAEPDAGYGSKSQRVEVWSVGTYASEFLDIRLHLIGLLGAAGSIQRRSAGADRKRAA